MSFANSPGTYLVLNVILGICSNAYNLEGGYIYEYF